MADIFDDNKAVSPEQQRLQDRYLQDFEKVLQTVHGRRVIWKILSDCGMFRTSMTGNSYVYFNEGRRDIGLRIFADIPPKVFMQMQNEYRSEKIQNKKEKGELNG